MCEIKDLQKEHVDYLNMVYDRLMNCLKDITNVNQKYQERTGFFNLGTICENIRININEIEDSLEEDSEDEEKEEKEEDVDSDDDRYITMSEVKKYFNGFKNHS